MPKGTSPLCHSAPGFFGIMHEEIQKVTLRIEISNLAKISLMSTHSIHSRLDVTCLLIDRCYRPIFRWANSSLNHGNLILIPLRYDHLFSEWCSHHLKARNGSVSFCSHNEERRRAWLSCEFPRHPNRYLLAKMVWPEIHPPSVTRKRIRGAMSLISVNRPPMP